MIITGIKQYKYDIYIKKVRAIVVDENNDIYVTYMNNFRIIPGGTIEDNENMEAAIIREIKEEVGVELVNPIFLGSIMFYHENFANIKHNPVDYGNRINEVNLFYAKINTKDIGKTKYTDFERVNDMKIEKYQLDALIKHLKDDVTDKYSEAMAEETLAALDLYKENILSRNNIFI